MNDYSHIQSPELLSYLKVAPSVERPGMDILATGAYEVALVEHNRLDAEGKVQQNTAYGIFDPEGMHIGSLSISGINGLYKRYTHYTNNCTSTEVKQPTFAEAVAGLVLRYRNGYTSDTGCRTNLTDLWCSL